MKGEAGEWVGVGEGGNATLPPALHLRFHERVRYALITGQRLRVLTQSLEFAEMLFFLVAAAPFLCCRRRSWSLLRSTRQEDGEEGSGTPPQGLREAAAAVAAGGRQGPLERGAGLTLQSPLAMEVER